MYGRTSDIGAAAPRSVQQCLSFARELVVIEPERADRPSAVARAPHHPLSATGCLLPVVKAAVKSVPRHQRSPVLASGSAGGVLVSSATVASENHVVSRSLGSRWAAVCRGTGESAATGRGWCRRRDGNNPRCWAVRGMGCISSTVAEIVPVRQGSFVGRMAGPIIQPPQLEIHSLDITVTRHCP